MEQTIMNRWKRSYSPSGWSFSLGCFLILAIKKAGYRGGSFHCYGIVMRVRNAFSPMFWRGYRNRVCTILVVIGLIISGVFAWKTLSYAAKMKMVGTELHQLDLAITTFRIKYNCLPGDCENATEFSGQSKKGCPPILSPSPKKKATAKDAKV